MSEKMCLICRGWKRSKDGVTCPCCKNVFSWLNKFRVEPVPDTYYVAVFWKIGKRYTRSLYIKKEIKDEKPIFYIVDETNADDILHIKGLSFHCFEAALRVAQYLDRKALDSGIWEHLKGSW